MPLYPAHAPVRTLRTLRTVPAVAALLAATVGAALATPAFAACPDLSGTYRVTASCTSRASGATGGTTSGSVPLPSDAAPAGSVNTTQPRSTITVEQTGCDVVLRYVEDYYADGSWVTDATATLTQGASVFAGVGERRVAFAGARLTVQQDYGDRAGAASGAILWRQTFTFEKDARGNLATTHALRASGGLSSSSAGSCTLERVP